ncbi:MAG: hypothetical protein KF768_07690 [Phycisphaeraceae bacterium]|nr:hypothetical protein [Phycisphaeraceae bacterium]
MRRRSAQPIRSFDPARPSQPTQPRQPARARRTDSVATFEALEPRQLLSSIPVVSMMQTDRVASEAGDDIARFGVKRTGSLAEPLVVRYTVGGTATPNEDYIGLSGTIRIPAGKRFARLPIIPIDDYEVEGNEFVIIRLQERPGIYSIIADDPAAYMARITILDDDVAPVVRVETPVRVATEFGPQNGLLVFTRSGPLEIPLTVRLRITGSANGNAEKGPLDYVPLPNRITFPEGVDRVELEVDALNDNLLEGNETVRVRILASDKYELDTSDPASYTSTVVIRDRPLVTLFTIDPVATTDPGDTGMFLLHRTGPLNEELRVSYTFTGTARRGIDFIDLPATLVFAPGQALLRVEIVGLGTSMTEPFKTVRMSLLNRPRYNLNLAVPQTFTADVRIFDDAIGAAI